MAADGYYNLRVENLVNQLGIPRSRSSSITPTLSLPAVCLRDETGEDEKMLMAVARPIFCWLQQWRLACFERNSLLSLEMSVKCPRIQSYFCI